MTHATVLGVVPARAGSKGIQDKNIRPINGQPLLTYTLRAAQGSRYLTRTVLSTDSAEYAAYAHPYDVSVPFLRPAELAQDDTLILPVLQHLLEQLKADGFAPDVVLLLQPTSPLRQSHHIDEALDTMWATNADTVVSVMPVPHQYVPTSLMIQNDAGLLGHYDPTAVRLRRQDKPTYYARNGPAVLATHREVLEGGRLYGDRIAMYEMSPADSIDIDTPLDLQIAEFLLQQRDHDKTNSG